MERDGVKKKPLFPTSTVFVMVPVGRADSSFLMRMYYVGACSRVGVRRARRADLLTSEVPDIAALEWMLIVYDEGKNIERNMYI